MKKTYAAAATAALFAANASATVITFDGFDKTGAFNGNGRAITSYSEGDYTLTPGTGSLFRTVTLSDPKFISSSAIVTGAPNGTQASVLTITGPQLFKLNSFDALNYFASGGSAANYTITSSLNGIETCSFSSSVGASNSNTNATTVNNGCNNVFGNSLSISTTARGNLSFDNINVVAAIPEPATWGIMVLGMAGVGAAMRSNRRRPAALAR